MQRSLQVRYITGERRNEIHRKALTGGNEREVGQQEVQSDLQKEDGEVTWPETAMLDPLPGWQ
jgi:hypothetical protein